MKNRLIFLCIVYVLLFLPFSYASTFYDVHALTSKSAYNINETMVIYGYVFNVTSNSTANTTSYLVENSTVSVVIKNSTNSTIASYTLYTNLNGSFYSNNTLYNTNVTILAPNSTGTYRINVTYTDPSNATWSSVLPIIVVSKQVDEITISANKASFSASESMQLTIMAVQISGDSALGVNSTAINGTVRRYNDSSIQSRFNCTTASDGRCYVTLSAPSSVNKYFIEVNNYLGYMSFSVVQFDIDLYVRDSTGTSYKNIFRTGESGLIEVRISSSSPSGSYNATGSIADSSGAGKQNMTSVLLNVSNGFVNSLSFTVNNAFTAGSVYTANATATDGTNTITKTAMFEVRDWTFNFAKRKTDSGFEYGYTVFPDTYMFLQVFPTERENSTVIKNLTDVNISISLKNALGIQLSNASVVYNASCGTIDCYDFNLTSPSAIGDYMISVLLNYSSVSMAQERNIKVTNTLASIFSADSEGAIKELFSPTEYVYIKVSAKNKTTNISISDVDVGALIYENGTATSYSQASGNTTNITDSTYEWVWNSSSSLLRLDPSKTGGIYILEMYANNRSAYATTKFAINPYDVCAQAKATSDTNTVDYWWQFRTTDTVYFQITINEAQNPSGKVFNTSAAQNGTYGIGSACSFDTTKKQAVTNATITIAKVLNTDSNREESLNTTSSICQSTDSSGSYLCTAQADDNRWDAGKHAVFFNVVDNNKNTTDKGVGFFETRAFYIYGYPNTWYNKNTDNITFSVKLYEAGSGWWSSGTGLSGTITIEKINNYGSFGEWIWPPVQYPYNTTGLNATTVTNGAGTLNVTVNRTKDGIWKSGNYAVVVKAVVNGETDYGEIWFTVRKWDAYALPVEVSGTNYIYKNSFNGRENISLYVRLSEAGGYSDTGGTYIGNVSIRVKSIQDYSKWPATAISTTSYNSTIAAVNTSSPWYSTSNAAQNYPGHVVNITKLGSWDPGYYSVVLDINGTETGYGWFNVINFQTNTFPANSTGSNNYYFTGTTPIYFNVTTTKSWKGSYAAADYVNTTIYDGVVRVWQQSTNSYLEFNYPENFNITPLNVPNGSAIISINKSTSWASGWYYGELTLKDPDNLTGKGWIYFSVKPFRISTSGNSLTSTTRNLSLNLSILEPEYSQNTNRFANYTVEKITETIWSYTGRTFRQYNFSPATNFTQNISLNVSPINGRWSPGWRYISVVVKDNNTNSTEEQWYSFQALPFQTSVSRTSGATIGPNTNVTVNVTLTDPITGARTTGNVSSVYYWGWPSKTQYRFVVGTCDSQVNGTCMVNGSATVTIVPPTGGWEEGYRYMYFNFIDSQDASSTVETWNSIYFEVRQTLSGYTYAVDKNANYVYRYTNDANVTMYLYSLQNLSGSAVSVNITNVQYAQSESNCWSDSCRNYQDVPWFVATYSNAAFSPYSGSNITGSGYVRLNKTGNWSNGEYYVRISVSSGGDTATIKNGYFRVVDNSIPHVVITSPALDSVIESSTLTVTATTSENAQCWSTIFDYGSYCGSSGRNTSLCNATKYSNATTKYYDTIYPTIRYLIAGGTILYESGTYGTSGGTSHSLTVSTAYMTNQHYAVEAWCYDNDWNYGTNATVILVNKSSATLSVTINSPANTTYNTTNISLNYNANGANIDRCQYNLNGQASVALGACTNITFIASEGSNNIRIYVNTTLGAVNSTIVYFSAVRNNTAPSSGLLIASNTTFSKGIHNLSAGINITSPNVWLNCNSAVLKGNGSGTDAGIRSIGYENITIANCTVMNFALGMRLQAGNLSLVLRNNSIRNNTVGINLTLSSTVTIANNSINNNTLYNFVNNQSANITVANNWWNLTNASLINQTIYDVYDDAGFGIAAFTPFLNVSVG